MKVNIGQALDAYANAGKPAGPGMDARDKAANPGAFAGMVKDALGTAAELGYKAEAESIKAVAGQANLSDVVTAVANAQVALDTVVAVRDRVIQAYQDIVRMPI
ncbi:MAG: flagellar hook-basal body complex protein FliE [Alphaproteobacteria bacterium]|nr:flagellar hook-basal body complex protein FliE [Alphaproteobacteria bacterium]